jgi:hypothetical protein
MASGTSIVPSESNTCFIPAGFLVQKSYQYNQTEGCKYLPRFKTVSFQNSGKPYYASLAKQSYNPLKSQENLWLILYYLHSLNHIPAASTAIF